LDEGVFDDNNINNKMSIYIKAP